MYQRHFIEKQNLDGGNPGSTPSFRAIANTAKGVPVFHLNFTARVASAHTPRPKRQRRNGMTLSDGSIIVSPRAYVFPVHTSNFIYLYGFMQDIKIEGAQHV